MDAYAEARNLFATDGSPLQVAECDYGAGITLDELGRYQEASDTYRSPRQVYAGLAHRDRVAECDGLGWPPVTCSSVTLSMNWRVT
jgi:hypothetical protein